MANKYSCGAKSVKQKPVQKVDVLKSLLLVPQACQGKIFMIHLSMKAIGCHNKVWEMTIKYLCEHPNDDGTLCPPCIVESC